MAERSEASSPQELEEGHRRIRWSVLFASLISAPVVAALALFVAAVHPIVVAAGLVAYWAAAALMLRWLRRNLVRRIHEVQLERAGLSEDPGRGADQA